MNINLSLSDFCSFNDLSEWTFLSLSLSFSLSLSLSLYLVSCNKFVFLFKYLHHCISIDSSFTVTSKVERQSMDWHWTSESAGLPIPVHSPRVNYFVIIYSLVMWANPNSKHANTILGKLHCQSISCSYSLNPTGARIYWQQSSDRGTDVILHYRLLALVIRVLLIKSSPELSWNREQAISIDRESP